MPSLVGPSAAGAAAAQPIFNLASGFGAVGDGVTDNTTAIQAWLNVVAAAGGVGIAPEGNWWHANPVYPGSGSVIMGGGQYRGPGPEVIALAASITTGGNNPTITANSPHGFNVGDVVMVSGFNGTGTVNGAWTVLATTTTTYQIGALNGITPNCTVVGSTAMRAFSLGSSVIAIASTTTSGNPVTVTTSSPHGLTAGQQIYVVGFSGSAALNGLQTVATILTATTFTVAVSVTVSGTGNFWVGRAARFTGNLSGVVPGFGAIPMQTTVGLAVGQIILIDGEAMYINAINGLNLTCSRGVNGTTAATTHSNNTPVFAWSGTQFNVNWANLAGQAVQGASGWYLGGVSGVTIRDLTLTSHGRTATSLTTQTAWALLDISNSTDILILNVEGRTSGCLGFINEGLQSRRVRFQACTVHDTIKDGIANWDGCADAEANACEVYDNGDDGFSINAMNVGRAIQNDNPPQRVNLIGCHSHDSKTGASWAGGGDGMGIIAQFVNIIGCVIRNVNNDGIVIYDFDSTSPALNVTAHHINIVDTIISGTGLGGSASNTGAGIYALGCRDLLVQKCRFSNIGGHGIIAFNAGGSSGYARNHRIVQNIFSSAGGNAAAFDGIGTFAAAGGYRAIFYVVTGPKAVFATDRFAVAFGELVNDSAAGTDSTHYRMDGILIDGNVISDVDFRAIDIQGLTGYHANSVQILRNVTRGNNHGNYANLFDINAQFIDNFDHGAAGSFNLLGPANAASTAAQGGPNFTSVTAPTGSLSLGFWGT